MDRPTIDAYDAAAPAFAADWLKQPPPDDMYALLARYFIAGGKTADIGCGAGRDVAWLNQHGFPVSGFDASAALLEQARAAYPSGRFEQALLPDLAGIPGASFDNVLCETVIMHLPPPDVAAACARLIDILTPGGVLYLSWRVAPDGQSTRDAYGRLYAAFDEAWVREGLRGAHILLDEDAVNASSGKRVRRVVARRT